MSPQSEYAIQAKKLTKNFGNLTAVNHLDLDVPRARIYGFLMLTLLPGGTLGPIFAGVVHDRTGSYELAFQLFAVLNAVSFVLLMFLRDERPTARTVSA